LELDQRAQLAVDFGSDFGFVFEFESSFALDSGSRLGADPQPTRATKNEVQLELC
jgi:hypothetical protein